LTLYLDTSLLVAALTRESKTATVQRWLREQSTTALALSDWTITEFSAALSLKLSATDHGRRPRFWPNSRLGWKRVSRSFRYRAFRTAAHFADHHALGLRAGDVLHLAVCADQGATLCTLDRHLGKAGPSFGVKTTLL
jgi:predicted nucleic acid-binding protein